MSFVEETQKDGEYSPDITVKRELDDFDNRKITNEIDGEWDQKPTIEILSHIKSEEANLETQTEVDFSPKEDPLTVEHIAVERELDNFNNGKTANEDLDQKSTIKSEEGNFIDSQYLISHEEVNIKNEEDVEQSDNCDESKDQIKIHKCPDCTYQSKFISRLKRHSIRHRKPDEIVWYRCTECSYKTEWKKNIKQHAVVVHNMHQLKQVSTDKWHACPQCPYKTIRKCSLNRHIRTHACPDGLEWYQCKQCPYKTYREHRFIEHLHYHKWLHCTFCSYKTLHKFSFKKHLTIHQDDDSPSWHKCPECPYKATHKYNLQKHAKKHKAADQTDWLQCPECSFRTRQINHLKEHQTLHNGLAEWFRCFNCPYKTNWKRSLVFHMKMHL